MTSSLLDPHICIHSGSVVVTVRIAALANFVRRDTAGMRERIVLEYRLSPEACTAIFLENYARGPLTRVKQRFARSAAPASPPFFIPLSLQTSDGVGDIPNFP